MYRPKTSNQVFVSGMIVLFAVVGTIFLVHSHASTPVASLESETGTLSGNAQNIADTSASGGHAIRFNAPAGGTSTLPALGAATYSTTSGIHLSYTDFQTQMQGDLKVRRSYDTSVPSSITSSAAAADIARNDITDWSMQVDPVQFANGTWDTQFRSFLNSIPAGHQTYVAFWHEPEDEIVTKKTMTLANWQAAVNHMGQLVHATGRSDIHNSIILQGMWTFYSGGYGGTEFWDSGFDANVDDVGMDIYANGVDSNDFTQFTPIPNKLGYTQMMSWLNLHVIGHGKTWGLPEIGAHENYCTTAKIGVDAKCTVAATSTQIASEDQKKAQWITDSWAWAKANNLKYYIYFNYNATSGLPDNQSNIILQGSPAETAFRAMVAEANR